MEALIADLIQSGATGAIVLGVYWYATRDRIADLKDALAAEQKENAEWAKFHRDTVERALQRKGSSNGRSDT